MMNSLQQEETTENIQSTITQQFWDPNPYRALADEFNDNKTIEKVTVGITPNNDNATDNAITNNATSTTTNNVNTNDNTTTNNATTDNAITNYAITNNESATDNAINDNTNAAMTEVIM